MMKQAELSFKRTTCVSIYHEQFVSLPEATQFHETKHKPRTSTAKRIQLLRQKPVKIFLMR